MESSMREVSFRTSDFDLFGQDMSPADYEFFKKHSGAFKRMMEDQSKEKKQEFVDAFKEFSVSHGCLKDISAKTDSRLVYLQEATQMYKETFVNGKLSTAKNIVTDAAILAQNKNLLPNMGAKSYSRDPFFHKETRDVFRRLFGSPSVDGTFIKVICILPLHIKFGGSICRYLRRWLDVEPVRSLPSQASASKKSSKQSGAPPGRSTSKKKEKELAKLKEEEDRKEFQRFQMFINEFVASQETDPYRLSQIKAALEAFEHPDFVRPEPESTIPDEKPSEKTETVESHNEKHLSLAEHLENKKTKGKNDDQNSSENKIPSEEKDDVYTDKMMEHYQNEGFFKPMSSEKETDEDKIDDIEKMLLLNKPHPNEQYEQLLGKKLSKENELKLKQCKENAKQQRKADKKSDDVWSHHDKERKRHACANCRKVEPEPKTFKKCQRCRGKRTKFYCSRTCQETDWLVHRDDHNSIEDVT
ncbi:axoneme-associated protein mst101(2) [Exaiptasia diaphana]|uniref:MYND-type domain-containing protein n=1 Tax=Exaiptasia diaphana TaxID=2652724 RepID=A0A913Y6S3_EXADI|nr:axoneme-associated protein mst101(2) [Exaiptasia diaphana]KXJ28849.1 hypothetical protein AC249_AIPGENE4026 [Exaiptasia diaphana]